MKPRRLEAEPLTQSGACLGESPVWDATGGRVLWVDVVSGRVLASDPSSGHTNDVHAFDDTVGFVAMTEDQRLVAGVGLTVQVRGPQGTSVPIHIDEPATNRLNDGKPDPWGRVWAGTMDRDLNPERGTLYRVADGRHKPILRGLSVSNGMEWFSDTMYFIDSGRRCVTAYTFDGPEGTIGDRRILSLPDLGSGVPDGMTVDEEGFLWIACYGSAQVRRLSPDGKLVAVVDLPVSAPTSVCFGGKQLDHLYVTTAQDSGVLTAGGGVLAGRLFVCTPGVRGRLPNRAGLDQLGLDA